MGSYFRLCGWQDLSQEVTSEWRSEGSEVGAAGSVGEASWAEEGQVPSP